MMMMVSKEIPSSSIRFHQSISSTLGFQGKENKGASPEAQCKNSTPELEGNLLGLTTIRQSGSRLIIGTGTTGFRLATNTEDADDRAVVIFPVLYTVLNVSLVSTGTNHPLTKPCGQGRVNASSDSFCGSANYRLFGDRSQNCQKKIVMFYISFLKTTKSTPSHGHFSFQSPFLQFLHLFLQIQKFRKQGRRGCLRNPSPDKYRLSARGLSHPRAAVSSECSMSCDGSGFVLIEESAPG